MGDRSGPPSWQEIRERAIKGVEATIEQLVVAKKGDALAREPVALPTRGSQLEILTTLQRRWDSHAFYVVDADLGSGRPEDKHPVRLHRFKGQRLTFVVSDDTRTALGSAVRVRVFCASDFEITLAKTLLKALRGSTRGDALEQLWRSEQTPLRPFSPPFLSQSLNPGQQLAFAAMTTPGGFFVWGPPGTGKTKVITAAVRHAIERDQSVLIASNTHVAVDNVLEGLANATQAASDPFALRPGVAIRNASVGTLDRVSRTVREHPFLTVDKAAAVMTDQATRRAELDEQRAANSEHVARVRLDIAINQLSDVDVGALHAAQRAIEAAAEVKRLRRSERELDEIGRRAAESAGRNRAVATSLGISEEGLRRAHVERDQTERLLQEAQAALTRADADLEASRLDLEAVRLRLAQTDEDAGRLRQRIWPPASRSHRRRVADLEVRDKELSASVLRGTERRKERNHDREQRQTDAHRARSAAEELDERAREAHRLSAAAREDDDRHAGVAAQLDELRTRIDGLLKEIAAVPSPAEVVALAEQGGWFAKIAEVRSATQRSRDSTNRRRRSSRS